MFLQEVLVVPFRDLVVVFVELSPVVLLSWCRCLVWTTRKVSVKTQQGENENHPSSCGLPLCPPLSFSFSFVPSSGTGLQEVEISEMITEARKSA